MTRRKTIRRAAALALVPCFLFVAAAMADEREEGGSAEAGAPAATEADGAATWQDLRRAEHGLVQAAGEVVAAMKPHLENGVKGLRPTALHALATVEEQLADEDWRVRLDGFAAFLVFAGEHLQQLGQRELRNEAVEVRDLKKHAFMYRLGALTEGFFSEDGTVAGVLDPSGAWNFEPPAGAGAIGRIVETMRERQAPALVAVPILTPVERAEPWTPSAQVPAPDQDGSFDAPEDDAEAAALERALSRQLHALSGLADRLAIQVREAPDSLYFAIPASDALREDEDKEWADRIEQAAAWLDLYGAWQAGAGQVRLGRGELRTANGALEEVELLSAGRMAFAYRTAADGRIGYAVNSPADASGFRWVEGLESGHLERLEAIFAQGEERTPGFIEVPVDVTGRIRAETAVRNGGWGAILAAGGPVMVPLGLCALVALLVSLERFFVLQRAGRGRHRLAAEVLAACAARDFDTAVARCRRIEGVVGRVLLACLQRRHQGQHAMEDTIQEQLLHEVPKLERFLAGIAVLGAVAPLFGLLGTVTGIIQTFDIITTFGSVQPGAMAGGISEALITTASGLVVAIPILLLHSLLAGKADRIVSDAEKYAASLMLALSQDGGDAP